MYKHPLYMTVAEFSEILRNNVYSANAFDPNEKYHPLDLAATFSLAADIMGSTIDQVISNERQRNRNGTD